uniref:Secreted protein n=1 Tax=Caenorhabditis tropicalis TaxID=1561998 RepID=A0A1I7UII7_9PELO
MILLLLLSLSFLGIHSDPVNVEVFIRCDPSISLWSGQLKIFEDDIRYSELLATVNVSTGNMTQLLILPPLYPGGDHGWQYEIGYQFEHNCTHSGKPLCITPPPTDISEDGP